MNMRFLFEAAFCWPLHAAPDNFAPDTREIPWVQLWTLHADDKNFQEEVFLSDKNEFIRYCSCWSSASGDLGKLCAAHTTG